MLYSLVTFYSLERVWTDSAIATIPVGSQPNYVAYNLNNNNNVYVSNFGSKSVSIIDISANKVIDTIPVGGIPIGIAYNK